VVWCWGNLPVVPVIWGAQACETPSKERDVTSQFEKKINLGELRDIFRWSEIHGAI